MDNTPNNASRKLYRDTKNQTIGGVCAGLAEYFHVDLVAVRAAFLISIFFGGAGIIVYLILWIAMPAKPLA